MTRQHLGIVLGVMLWGPGVMNALGSPPALQVDGEPFFPLGWYTQYLPTSTSDATQYLSNLKNDGMNAALTCYYTWRADYLTYMQRMLLGGAAQQMKIMVEIRRCAVEGPCPTTDIDTQVAALKGYPALLGWYLIDQPEYKDPVLTTADLQPRYAQIATGDTIGHPILVEHGSPPNNHTAGTYLADTPPPYCNALMTNIYPCRPQYPELQGPLWWVAQAARVDTQSVIQYGLEAYINVVQAHFHPEGTLRLPTYPEQRYIAYAPIVEGARGLFFWMYHLDWTTQQHIDEVVGPIAQEIASLIPAILSDITSVSVTSDHDTDTTGHGVEDVTYLLGADANWCYLMAVNNTSSSLSVQFTISGAILAEVLPPSSTSIPVLFEDRNVTLEPTGNPTIRTLSDNCSPYDVNVYRLFEAVVPDQVTNPSPPDQATSMWPSINLGWTGGANTTSYDVYLGTSNPPDFRVNRTQATYDPGPLDPHETYYWRIDAVNDFTKTEGVTWTFETLFGDFDADGDVDSEDFGHFQACLSGSGQSYPGGCHDADANDDSDVDAGDFGVFQGCMGGPDQPPGC